MPGPFFFSLSSLSRARARLSSSPSSTFSPTVTEHPHAPLVSRGSTWPPRPPFKPARPSPSLAFSSRVPPLPLQRRRLPSPPHARSFCQPAERHGQGMELAPTPSSSTAFSSKHAGGRPVSPAFHFSSTPRASSPEQSPRRRSFRREQPRNLPSVCSFRQLVRRAVDRSSVARVV